MIHDQPASTESQMFLCVNGSWPITDTLTLENQYTAAVIHTQFLHQFTYTVRNHGINLHSLNFKAVNTSPKFRLQNRAWTEF
jgi:hypothetical protein